MAIEPSSDGEHRIQRVLTRRSAVVRGAPGDRRLNTQVLAANVDVVFVVTSVNAEFNIRRLERYLSVAWESGATPVVLLSKSDLADDLETFRLQAEAAAPAVEIIAVSSVTGEGIEEVRGHLGAGRTVVFTGSSGVGKSSIVNALAGEPLLDTGGIRLDDARGRHTTTRRQLVRLADGLLIDTPGLRELGVLDADGVATAFDDIEAVAATCRFGDCQHRSEPGCAVRAALDDGTLEAGRLEAYQKLQREARRAALATDAIARRAERKRWTAMTRSVERAHEAEIRSRSMTSRDTATVRRRARPPRPARRRPRASLDPAESTSGLAAFMGAVNLADGNPARLTGRGGRDRLAPDAGLRADARCARRRGRAGSSRTSTSMPRFAPARSSTGSRAGSGRIGAARASGARCSVGGAPRRRPGRTRRDTPSPDLPQFVGFGVARVDPGGHGVRRRRTDYRRIRYGFEMRRRLDEPIPDAELPPGIELRPVREADHRKIWDADVEAFRDHWEPRDRDEGDFEATFTFPDLDTSLWRVAWDGDEVVGSVMNAIFREENAKVGLDSAGSSTSRSEAPGAVAASPRR